MKLMKTIPVISGAILTSLALVSCAGRTNDNVEPTGETIEVNPVAPSETDSMNHDAEAVTLPDAIEVPE